MDCLKGSFVFLFCDERGKWEGAVLLNSHHYLLYSVLAAVRPRYVIMMKAGSEGQLVTAPTLVRVGQALDVAGQPGTPNTITGFQTMTTPVLLTEGQRVEMGTKEWKPLTEVLEDIVLVEEGEDDEKDTEKPRPARGGPAGAAAPAPPQ